MGGGAAAGRPARRGTQARPNVRLIVPCGAFTPADSVAGMRRPAAVIIALLISLAIAPAGRATDWTDFSTLTPSANPQVITRGPDGALWFTERDRPGIGRIDSNGTVTEFTTA